MPVAIVCLILLACGMYVALLISGFVKPHPRVSVIASALALLSVLSLEILIRRAPESIGFWLFVVLFPFTLGSVAVGVASGGMGVTEPHRRWHVYGLVLGMIAGAAFLVSMFTV